MNAFNLITTIYNQSSNQRLEEFIFCIKSNLQNKAIDKIFIFLEEPKENPSLREKLKQYSNVELVIINKRPTFYDFFTFCNKYKNTKWILSNSDIYFPKEDETNLSLLLNQDYGNNFYVLTRYNIISELSQEILKTQTGYIKNLNGISLRSQHKGGDSIDSWIFESPLDISKINANIEIGRFQCDGMISYELSKIKKLKNPCLSVISIHKHLNWNESSYMNIEYNGKNFSRPEWSVFMKEKGHGLLKVAPSQL